jgi:hypothetical protein
MRSPAQAIRRSGDSHGKFPMIPLYSLLAIGLLLLALYAARRVTKREKLRRARPRRKLPASGVRRMSARSEMRAYGDPTTVIGAITRPGAHRHKTRHLRHSKRRR